MLTIFWRTIKDRKISLLVYCATGILLLWMYVAMFPALREQSADFEKLLESFPQEIFQAFGIQELNFSTIESFLAVEHFSIVWPIIAICLVLGIAGAALAGEVENGTVEILLSRPVSRLQIFLARYLVGFFCLLVFTMVSIIAIVPLAALHHIDYDMKNHFFVAIISFLFGWAIFSIAILFSAFFSEKNRVFIFTSGILLVMYVLNIIATLVDGMNGLKYLSFFYYYNYNDALVHCTLDTRGILVFVMTAVVCTTCAGFVFEKRDLAV